ncbi:transcription termination factor Rho [Mycolicibacterium bacteremicum]|uniref:Transcription termination factor Rho n=1 Tax=Mycolicibacterium bacteremicum TaxID=564198 RepID=A0A1W9YS63_MYCBA|nr:transcription termination factor Rho [Mycolicibacterium bacteremicum]ORA02873.1 transcription termination factor Rho [Mycolicibacterium bacteremicum]
MTDTDLITAADSGSAPAEAMTSTSAAPSAGAGRGRSGSLTSMLLPDLRALASEVGVKGTSGMRKSDLIAAIREHRGESAGAKSAPAEKAEKAPKSAPVEQPTLDSTPEQSAQAETGQGGDAPQQSPQRRERRSAGRQSGAPDNRQDSDTAQSGDANDNTGKGGDTDTTKSGGAQQGDRNENANRDNTSRNDNSDRNENSNRNDRADQQDGNQNRNANNSGGGNQNSANNQNNNDDDEGRGGRRGRRFRDRRRRGERSGGGDGGGQGGGGGDRDTELREDDVVQPVAGILDVLDNYAFVRTSGYLAGPNDVYVSMNMVRKNGLRRGDAVTGAVRVAREGESSGGNNPRQKFNPLVRLDTVNGGPVENAKNRPDFTKLTPLYPNQRLRLETTPDRLTTRVIDLIMPIGKGQRALIVSPPKAGKTTIMQDIANAITRNNPECHLMVVLVDERPEEVTDMQRSVKGEVIASTFDRPPSDHTQAAELAIERAKRLVEQGKDVVVLLDSITRLGRAYNNASPASGRILSGGVDSTALYPPKRFLGAARNIEHGGSLTIIATAMVETGSTGDTVIFEEFKGTGNAELKLDRKIAERRVFPAVDVNPSGTRKDELLLGADEFAIVHKLRRVLSGLDSHQAIDLLMSQLRKTKTNYEFLVQVSKTTPGGMDND